MMRHGKLRQCFSTCIFIVVLNSFSVVFTFSQSFASLPQYPPQQPYWYASAIGQQESGPWGPWTQSSECSRTCGGGIAYQTRICKDIRSRLPPVRLLLCYAPLREIYHWAGYITRLQRFPGNTCVEG